MSREEAGRLSQAYASRASSSFVEFLAEQAPDLLPGRLLAAAAQGVSDAAQADAPHATTVVAVTYPAGVVMAGDRRATMGTYIAHREMEKVFPADEYSAVGIAGTAGLAVELVRLFQLELEHYEKIEGAPLSLDGKANRLSTILRAQLPLALRGLAVMPLLAGFDRDTGRGRILSYDVTGGRYDEREHHAIGSGAVVARGSMKNRWRPGLSESEAVAVAVEALSDAADDDAATAGPDRARRIWPVVAKVTIDGYAAVPESQLAAVIAGLARSEEGGGE